MKLYVISSFVLLCLISTGLVSSTPIVENIDSPLDITTNALDFESFKVNFKKSYSSQTEHLKRKAIFETNMKKIDEYNKWAESNGLDSRLGVNEFTDLDSAEFRKSHTGYKRLNWVHNNITGVVFTPKATVPDSWDWRSQKKVNAIKNQGNCGSCWAFAVTSIAETSYAIKYNKLPVLSEQQLVDCSTQNSGCNGGDPYTAANYVMKSGLMQSSYYPYVAYQHRTCKSSTSGGLAKPKNVYQWSGSESGLKSVVSQIGPVSIAIYATDLLQNYESGIFSDDENCADVNESDINHAVVIVGYGSENGKDYWIVRNHWGSSWGENGYFRLPRGSNYCGVMTEVVYLTF